MAQTIKNLELLEYFANQLAFFCKQTRNEEIKSVSMFTPMEYKNIHDFLYELQKIDGCK